MQSGRCGACGAPLTAGAQFCAYCGAPVSGSPSSAPPPPSLPSAGVPPGTYPAGFGAPPSVQPRRKRSRVLIIVVIVIAVVLIVAAVSIELLVPGPPSVQVGNINIWAPDNVCGLNTNEIYYPGYSSNTSQAIQLELSVPNYNSSACTVRDVVTNSSGFVLSDVQTGVTIPGDGNNTLNLTVTSPGSAFSGNLNLVFS